MKPAYYVKAIWDSEASVWISESNIPGLVIEADNLVDFETFMQELAPQMLSINADVHDERVAIDFSASAHRELAVA